MDILTLGMLLAGLVLLLVGAEWLVRGAAGLAMAMGISPLVVGLTVVAFGTSSPELAVSVQSGLAGQSDVALGNVIGSNIFNVLFILGICAALVPLSVARQLVWRDVPLMIGAAFLMFGLALDGQLSRFDGLLLVGGIVAYIGFSLYKSRRPHSAPTSLEPASPPVRRTPRWLAMQAGLLVLGLAMLVVGSNWLVEGAVALARTFGVSELIIGLTVVAIGTSLPEIATSIVASLRGERDIAVGNVVGSNLFNTLAILGIASLVSPMNISPIALQVDLPIMLAVLLACLPIFFTGFVVARWEGLLLLAGYAAYTLYLVLHALQAPALPLFSQVMVAVVLPLVGGLLVLHTLYTLRSNRQRRQQGELPHA